MNAIRFPGSVGISSNGSRTESSHHEVKKPLYIKHGNNSNDMLDISEEAKLRFEKDTLIKLDRVKLKKEAENYRQELTEYIDFKEADLRNIYRLDKIRDARRKIFEGIYDNPPDEILKKLVAKPEL